jgi:MFS family permease
VSRARWLPAGGLLFVAGWGANHFAPLLLLYKREFGLSNIATAAIFAAYAVGLIPSFLVGGPLADRFGRRRVAVPAVVAGMFGSVTLMLGARYPAALYSGRVLVGLSAGAAFTAATAWVRDLSSNEPAGTGARRAASCLSAGFALGPLVSGAIAQWGPAPAVVPYVIHLILTIPILGAASLAPEIARVEGRVPTAPKAWLGPSADVRFWKLTAPAAPWVFASVTIAFVTLPSLVGSGVSAAPIAYAGLVTAIALATGIGAQPAARWLDRRTRFGQPAGLACCVVGCIVGAMAVGLRSPLLALFDALILGAGYGILIATGLTAVERLARPEERARLASIFYCLAYSGIGAPYVIAALARYTSNVTALLAAGGLAAATGLYLLTTSPLLERHVGESQSSSR